MKLKILSVILLFGLLSCNNNEKNNQQTLMVYAAHGADMPVKEICDTFSNNTNIKIETNFASSGILARQMDSGAEVDLFISANKKWMDFLKVKKILENSSISIFARNKLVIICKNDNDSLNIDFNTDFDINSSIKHKIAIGNPEHVPAGEYAKQALFALNWFDKTKEQTILTMNVAAVTHYVAMGECDWGIVYSSEVLKSNKVKIAYEIPQELYDPIVFYIARIKKSKVKTDSLLSFFKQKTANEIINKHGFAIE